MNEGDYIEVKEREYQNGIIKMFQDKLRYNYLGNLDYGKNGKVNSEGKENSPIREKEVRKFLTKMGYTDMQIKDAISGLRDVSRLTDPKFIHLAEVNNSTYERLIYGFSLKPSQEEKEQDVNFFDFQNPLNNDFYIAEEVSYIDKLTGYNCRPDLVIYINGIAVCVIELKRSIISIEEGIKQNLSNERDLIPSFFTTTQFTVAARHADHLELSKGETIQEEMYGFKYGTIGTPLSFWTPWKNDTTKTGIVLSDTESFLQFFDKEQLMFMLRYGVLSDGGVKKVMRPHQYHALRAAEPRLRSKASGVIWHSQGSGKSLTMVWLASYIKNNFEDPRVIVITDRTELDIQLGLDFGNAGDNFHRASSQYDLLKTLKDGKEWLITTLIHKFGNHNNKKRTGLDGFEEEYGGKIPLDKYLRELKATINRYFPEGFKAKGKNIFIFVDECHRTQGGRLHDAMRSIMGQDVMLIGFTGTPLLKDQKKKGYNAFKNLSELKFGTFIHKYLHKNAVEDKVILDLQYEAREVDQRISNKEKLDKKLEQITTGLSDERKEMIRQRWATLEHVYSASERIERIGYSIIDDMENSSILRQDWANAMLVAGNIYSAYKYYEFFQNKCEDTRLRDHIAVVTSYIPNDNDIRKDVANTALETQNKFKYDMALQAYHDAGLDHEKSDNGKQKYNSDKYEAWAKDMFVNKPGVMKLLIVVDKLLTGFDAPCATYLYIDKDMRDQTLFQAICRVNRLGTDVKDENDNIICKTHKEYGLIIDFKHLFDNIENAITKFNDENGALGGFDKCDIEGLLEDNIAKNKKRLLAADDAFCALKGTWQRLNLTNNDLLAQYYVTDKEGDPARPRRATLYSITEKLTSSYDNMADFMGRAGFSTEEADKYEKHAREAAHINAYIKLRSGDVFDVRNYDPEMRALLDRYLVADEAEVIVKATEDFSFLDMIGNGASDEEIIDQTNQRTNGDEKASAEIIEGRARSVINNAKDRDPELYIRFSERLQYLLDEIHQRSITFAEEMRQLISLIRAAKSGGSNYPESIVTQRQKAFWNNRIKCGFSSDEKIAVEQVLRADNLVENEAAPNFANRASSHGILFWNSLKKTFKGFTDEQLNEIYNLAVQNTRF